MDCHQEKILLMDDSFKKQCKSIINENDFDKKVQDLMIRRDWTSREFCIRTGLSESVYKKINSHSSVNISRKSVMAICVGLGAAYEESLEILRLAGYVLSSADNEQIAYSIILNNLGRYNKHNGLDNITLAN